MLYGLQSNVSSRRAKPQTRTYTFQLAASRAGRGSKFDMASLIWSNMADTLHDKCQAHRRHYQIR